jgi:alanine-synthesizing transaminase
MFADRTNWNLAPNRLSEALAKHRSSGKPLIDMTASNPTECGFAYDDAAILKALSSPAVLAYEPDPKGLLAAREAIAGYYSARGITVAFGDIFLTTSTSEAYSFVFRLLCNSADEILIPSPSYPLFDLLADIQDVRLVRYPLVYDHGWQIDFHALESVITSRTRGIIVVNPNNPTGHFAKPEELSKLNQICSTRGMALIADEVFLDYSLLEQSALTFAANSSALTFTMSGLSKISGLPQMKVAWLVTSGPRDIKTEALNRLEVIADTFLSMNMPTQVATPALLRQREGFQTQLMARVRSNLAELDRQLAAHKVSSRLKTEGGWYALIRVPATRPDEDLAIDLLATKGVYVHPCHFFDFAAKGILVVSLITSERDFKEGTERLLSFFR